ncbi:hypothetical protein FA13DRAFT_1737812 [Coprinellus micaceus]|uniref:Uncharacterized protein n=1 Tax=Coprinellus micaceus TaxID=71717 RepID=A0A4Y7SW17_COPMI|nr:hypothetical protein FA13DRAFT_1737812 [Coprinellus micaceus]
MSPEATRGQLRLCSVYLGDENVSKRLQWVKEGPMHHRLVDKAGANAYFHDIHTYNAKEPFNPPREPPSAPLSAIVRLRRDPCIPALEGDFETAYNNMKQLQWDLFPEDQANKVAQSVGIIDWRAESRGKEHGFKIGHRVFHPKEAGKGVAIERVEDSYGGERRDDSTFSLNVEEWPMSHPAAREILAKLQATHDVFPLQAYDIRGDLIHPQHYGAKLRGSVVRLDFHLKHWFLQERNCFTADIARGVLSQWWISLMRRLPLRGLSQSSLWLVHRC